MTKYRDPSAKCLAMAHVPDPRFGDGTQPRTVICQKSTAHNTAKTKKAQRHYDPDSEVYWNDEDLK